MGKPKNDPLSDSIEKVVKEIQEEPVGDSFDLDLKGAIESESILRMTQLKRLVKDAMDICPGKSLHRKSINLGILLGKSYKTVQAYRQGTILGTSDSAFRILKVISEKREIALQKAKGQLYAKLKREIRVMREQGTPEEVEQVKKDLEKAKLQREISLRG